MRLVLVGAHTPLPRVAAALQHRGYQCWHLQRLQRCSIEGTSVGIFSGYCRPARWNLLEQQQMVDAKDQAAGRRNLVESRAMMCVESIRLLPVCQGTRAAPQELSKIRNDSSRLA